MGFYTGYDPSSVTHSSPRFQDRSRLTDLSPSIAELSASQNLPMWLIDDTSPYHSLTLNLYATISSRQSQKGGRDTPSATTLSCLLQTLVVGFCQPLHYRLGQ